MSRSGVARLLLALLVACFLWHAAGYDYYQVEDSYISLRYARNLARGQGPVFNPGERVEGYSNFSWVLLMAGCALAGRPLAASAQAVGALCGAVTLLLVYSLARRLLPDRPILALAAPALTAASPVFVLWSVAGLETPLFALLLTGSVLLHHRSLQAGRGFGWTGLLLGGAALTRPEGLGSFGLLLGTHLVYLGLQRRRPGRSQIVLVASFLGLWVPHLAFRLVYYGDWWPNTFYVKTTRFRGGGWRYLRAAVPHVGWITPPLALAGLTRRIPETVAVLWVLILGHSAYVIRQGGDWMPMGRYLAPLIPLLAVLAVLGLARLPAMPILRRRTRLSAALMAALVTVGCLQAVVSAHRPRVGHAKLRWEVLHHQQWRAIGAWLGREAEPGDVLVTGLGGIIPFTSDLATIDRGGLMDREIARIIQHAPDQATENRRVDRVVLARRPRFMLIPGFVHLRDAPLSEAAELAHWELWRQPEFQQAYELRHARIVWEGGEGLLPYYLRREEVP